MLVGDAGTVGERLNKVIGCEGKAVTVECLDVTAKCELIYEWRQVMDDGGHTVCLL